MLPSINGGMDSKTSSRNSRNSNASPCGSAKPRKASRLWFALRQLSSEQDESERQQTLKEKVGLAGGRIRTIGKGNKKLIIL
jgi:hypothetical protein